MGLIEMSSGAVSVKVGPNTPRTRMIRAQLLRRMALVYKDYAASLHIEEELLDGVMTEFCTLCAVLREPKGLDFEFITLADNDQQLLAKFERYIDTEHSLFLRGAMDAVKRLDAPSARVTQPTPLGEDAPKN